MENELSRGVNAMPVLMWTAVTTASLIENGIDG